MGAFGGLILTNKGRNLQAKAQTGKELKYTRIGVGDGQLGGRQIVDLTALVSEKKSLNLTKLKVNGGGRATVGTILSNQNISAGFYLREIGVFALDPDEGEILYCYGNAGSTAEYIPVGGGPDVIEKNIDIITIVGNASNVSAVLDTSMVFVSKSEFDDHLEAINPHKVTAAQIGAETPEGAAIKAAAVLSAANDYTDQKVSQINQEVVTLEQAVNAHVTDYVKHPGYGTTAGTATAYTLTLNPPLTELAAGVGAVIKVHVASGANPTLNINGKGAKAIKKPNGNTAKLDKDGVYTVRYDGSAFILQGEGGVEVSPNDLRFGVVLDDIVGTFTGDGNITPADVAKGKVGYAQGVRVVGELEKLLIRGGVATINLAAQKSQTIRIPISVEFEPTMAIIRMDGFFNQSVSGNNQNGELTRVTNVHDKSRQYFNISNTNYVTKFEWGANAYSIETSIQNFGKNFIDILIYTSISAGPNAKNNIPIEWLVIGK